MDSELVNIIYSIQSIKQDQYKKHRPELVDGKSVLSQQLHGNLPENEPPKSYIRLINEQRTKLYRHDYEAQEKAKKTFQELTENSMKNEIASSPSNGELCRPWSKVPRNLKIQLILTFIESLVPKLIDEQKNQLRYLLISAISQKKLMKQSDVDYNSDKGQLIKINCLSYNGKNFELNDNDVSSIPFSIIPDQIVIQKPKKKLILIKTS